MKIKEIKFDSLGCLKNFELDIDSYNEDKLNLFVLVGSNGSGKSTFLDALYSITKDKNINQIQTKFSIRTDNDDFVWANNRKDIDNASFHNPWEYVIRYYTGNSQRSLNTVDEYDSENYMSFSKENMKWLLAACFLSGIWKDENNLRVIEKLNSILFYGNNTFEPIEVFLKLKNYDKDILEKLPKYDNITNDGLIISWKIKAKKEIDVTSILDTLIKKQDRIENLFFTYNRNEYEKPLPDETLSDGELGLIRRASLITFLKEMKDKKCLVLLDEPETHFNENWKRHFIYLIKSELSNTKHDIFIATHSAMLLTDVKKQELYHFKLVNNKIKTYPIIFNTYAANIIDIGRAYFDLDSDIGEDAKENVKKLLLGVKELKANYQQDDFLSIEEQLNNIKELLPDIGPGEWRWKLRAREKELMNELRDNLCKNDKAN